MRLPKAPSWSAVFLFGAAWNAIIERSWWATCLCLAVVVILPALDRLDRHLFGPARVRR